MKARFLPLVIGIGTLLVASACSPPSPPETPTLIPTAFVPRPTLAIATATPTARATTKPTPLPTATSLPLPSQPTWWHEQVPVEIDLTLARRDIRSAEEVAEALISLEGSAPTLKYVRTMIVEDSEQVGVPAVIVWGGSKPGFRDGGVLLTWLGRDRNSWRQQSLFVERSYSAARAARMAQEDGISKLVLFADAGGGDFTRLQLYELQDEYWQLIWTPSGIEKWVWKGEASLRFVGEGIDEVELKSSSWLVKVQDDPKNSIFWEPHAGLHRWFIDTWKKEGDAYIFVSRRTIPSAYNTLVEFLYAMKTEGDAATWVTDPTLVQTAHRLNLGEWSPAYPGYRKWPRDEQEGPLFVDFTGQRITFHFEKQDNQYLIRAIESEPAPTATPSTSRQIFPPPRTATPQSMP